MGTKNDKVILSLKKEIEAKKKLLAKTTKFDPVTNCSLQLDGDRINIHVATKDDLLLQIAKLNALKIGLGVSAIEEQLFIGGYTIDEWLQDLTARYKYLNISNEKNRLQKLEEKLHNLLSVDTKVELEIEDLKSQI